MGKYQLVSNLKLIESGKIPTSDGLNPGEAAFGMLDDGKCHMFGNVGKTPDGPIVDISEGVTVPVPSSADNSKVLRVVDGKATWVSLPSASGVSF